MLLQSASPLSSCDSTQTIATTLAAEGATEGTVVWSLEQTAGRGRGDHQWSSPAGRGLWMSFILRPQRAASEWPVLTPLVSLAVAHAIEEIAGRRLHLPRTSPFRIGIKWPNDLYGGAGKIGGVLAEVIDDAVVVGVGVNLTQQQRTDFPDDIRDRASALDMEGIRSVTPLELFDEINLHLTTAYREFCKGDTSFLQSGLRARFYLRDAEVEIDAGAQSRSGKAKDLGPSGELCLQIDGRDEWIFGGSVTRFEMARPWTL